MDWVPKSVTESVKVKLITSTTEFPSEATPDLGRASARAEYWMVNVRLPAFQEEVYLPAMEVVVPFVFLWMELMVGAAATIPVGNTTSYLYRLFSVTVAVFFT